MLKLAILFSSKGSLYVNELRNAYKLSITSKSVKQDDYKNRVNAKNINNNNSLSQSRCSQQIHFLFFISFLRS